MQCQLISEHLKVTINNFGAEVCSVKNNSGLEFIWQANKDVWARHAPVLFPIVGKLKDNFFVFEGKEYQLPQHGFARDMEFDLIENNETSCTFQLVSNSKTKQIFSFDFIFRINYQLENNILYANYTVINPSIEKIYFSVGAHPGFNCPLEPNEKFEDYYLEFGTNSFSKIELNDGLRCNAKITLNLTDKKLFLNSELFNNDALVFEDKQIEGISLCSSKSSHKITLTCKDWPYFGIWTKKENPQFVCLEPWNGIADHENSKNELIKKEGIIQLMPQTEFNRGFSLIFS